MHRILLKGFAISCPIVPVGTLYCFNFVIIIVTMTIWAPTLTANDKSKYEAIADAIAADISNGSLTPGQKLPTQRSLARKLDVTVGTIGRAYALAEKRGLISLEVGRGSFVRSFVSRTNELASSGGVIDLGLNLPPTTQNAHLFGRTLAQISNSQDISSVFGNAPVESFASHRVAAAKWLADRCQSNPENTLICSGTQNALISTLASLTKPGDSVLVEQLTFPGMIAAAKFLHLKLIPLEMDNKGVLPDSLDREGKKARVLYCVPTNQNPTATTMSLTRRKQVAKLLGMHNIFLIEDDVYGKLIDGGPPSVASLAPERTILIASLAKTISIGLRLAYVCVPESIRQKVLGSMRATNFFPSPLLCDVATRLIVEGLADQLLDEFRNTARDRMQIAKKILPKKSIFGSPQGNHVWLHLPAAWSPATIAAAARENKINIYPANLFVPDKAPAPNAIRIALGAARNESELRIGLNLIARLLDDESVQSNASY